MPLEEYKYEPFFKGKLWNHNYKTRSYFIEQLFKKLNHGFSPIIGICGSQQTGKSFIAIYIAWLIHQCSDNNDIPFDPTIITFYDPETAILSLIGKRKYVTLIDEAGVLLDYRIWWEKAHQSIRHIVNTQAKNNNCYIFISPFISEIDRSARKHFDFKILVTKRGVFKTFRYVKKYNEEDIKKCTYPIFLDDLSIKLSDLPEGIFQKYLNFSGNMKDKILSETAMQNPKNEIEELRISYNKLHGVSNS